VVATSPYTKRAAGRIAIRPEYPPSKEILRGRRGFLRGFCSLDWGGAAPVILIGPTVCGWPDQSPTISGWQRLE
jgi:hypothetical protein